MKIVDVMLDNYDSLTDDESAILDKLEIMRDDDSVTPSDLDILRRFAIRMGMEGEGQEEFAIPDKLPLEIPRPLPIPQKPVPNPVPVKPGIKIRVARR